MARPLLVLLHGSGYDEHQLEGAGVDPAGRFRAVAPRALDALDSLVREVSADEGVDPSATVVGGFSQGGVLAFALATRERAPWRPAAVWSVCGAVVPERVGTRTFDLSYLCGVPVLFEYGTADPLVPTGDNEQGVAMLQRAGASLTVSGYTLGHEISASAVADARRWLEAR